MCTVLLRIFMFIILLTGNLLLSSHVVSAEEVHTTWYAPNNAILVIVGDVNPDKTMTMVRRFFEGIPSRPLPARKAVNLKPLKAFTIRLDTTR